MSIWETMKEIENQFLLFKNHSTFIVRERLYKGGSGYGTGLQPIHLVMSELVNEIAKNPVPEGYMKIKEEDFSKHIKKLDSSLQLLMFMVENDGDKNEMVKLFNMIEIEIQDLDNFFSEGFTFDPSSIQTEDELTNQRIFDLGLKIDDNFTQLSSSSEWRLRKSSSQVEQNFDFDELELLIEKAKTYALKNISEDYLAILSSIAVKIRDVAATDLSKLKEALYFFITISKILGEDLSFQLDGTAITSQYVKDDIEHKVNLKSLDWLIKVHNSITEEYSEEKYNKVKDGF